MHVRSHSFTALSKVVLAVETDAELAIFIGKDVVRSVFLR